MRISDWSSDVCSSDLAKTKAKASTSTALDPRTRLWALVAAGACLLPLLLQLPPVMGAVIAALAVAIAAATRPHRLPAWLRLLLAAALVGYAIARSHFSLRRDTHCALLAAMLALKPVEPAIVHEITHATRRAKVIRHC